MNIQNNDFMSLIEDLKNLWQNENEILQSFEDNLVSQVVQELMRIESIDNLLNNEEIKQFLFHEIKQINFFFKQKNTKQVESQETNQKFQESSDTISLSFIEEEQQLLNFDNSIQWQQVLKQYGNFFKPISHIRNYIETCKFDDIMNKYSNLIIQNKSDSMIYTGYNFETKEWIVVRKLKVNNQSMLEAKDQYLNNYKIYNQYPEIFLKLILPVYVQSNDLEDVEFASQLEYGEINLYDYSQQNQIGKLEIQLIFQQLYEQIQLLHKHNIAHRDIKPQNIIFVQHKGWLLCDFGDSLGYDNVNGIYNIRGTYSFLLPYLQSLAKIEGISIKQNLYHNDLYALAITLIVIKYQIQHSEQINHYLNHTDPLIEALRLPHYQNIEEHLIKHSSKFISPQINKQLPKMQSTYSYEYYITLIWVLNNRDIITQLTQAIVERIIEQIDEKLGVKDEYYNSLNCICYLRMDYQIIKQLKNLMKYSSIRQCKFWSNRIIKNKLLTQQRQNAISLIIQMYEFGFTQSTLKYGMLFLQNDYDFTVHIIVISLLKFLRQHDKALQEYNQLLRYREYKYMKEDELFLFVDLTLNEFGENLSKSDLQYIQNNIQTQLDLDKFQFIKEKYSDMEFVEQFMIKFNKLSKLSKHRYGNIQLFFKYLYQFQNFKNIQFTLLFIKQMKKHIKYYCQSFYWQKIICDQCETNLMLCQRQNFRKQMKKLNYNLLYNSETAIQSQVLRILKLNVLIDSKIQKKFKDSKITNQLIKIITNLDNVKYQLYQYIILTELIRKINDEVFERNPLKYFKIIIIILGKPDYILMFQQQEQQNLIQIAQKCFIETQNMQRFYQTIKTIEEKEKVPFRLQNLRKIRNQQMLIHKRRFEVLTDQFILFQYLK